MSNGLHITRISSIGIWLQARDSKYFLSFCEYPFLKNRPLNVLLNVLETAPGTLYWPEIHASARLEAPLKVSGDRFS